MVSNAAAAGGRLLMSAIFLIGGFQKLSGFFGTVAFMASLGLPLPVVVASAAVVIECLGGLFVLVGYQTRVVGLVLKNFAMAGGFLQLFAFGGGAWSIEAAFAGRRQYI